MTAGGGVAPARGGAGRVAGGAPVVPAPGRTGDNVELFRGGR